MPEAIKKVYVYTHTHWDREWWSTYEDFRIRLVKLMDKLVDILEKNKEYKSFYLDGQTIVLKDYLLFRPDMESRVMKLIREGRIEVGPWYILADEFHVSAESMIRNLLMSRRVASEYSIPLSQTGYLPDMFGHTAQMPHFFKGFDIPYALLWRGVEAEPGVDKADFIWKAPGGDEVLATSLQRTYGIVESYPLDRFHQCVDDSMEIAGTYASTSKMLLPIGMDHMEPFSEISGMIEEYNSSSAVELVHANLEEYFISLEKEAPVFGVKTGEFRKYGSRYAWAVLLPGVNSSRMYLKQKNHLCQNLLEKYAEPLSSIAYISGKRYETDMLWYAWEMLLQNQAHDSICGCSIDDVHVEMETRYSKTGQVAECIIDESIKKIAESIKIKSTGKEAVNILVYNPNVKELDYPVKVFIPEKKYGKLNRFEFQLFDIKDNLIAFQTSTIKEKKFRDKFIELYNVFEFTAKAVPGLGYATFKLQRIGADDMQGNMAEYCPEYNMDLTQVPMNTAIRFGNNFIENIYYVVKANVNGTINVLDKKTGKEFKGLLYYEDMGDAGDVYNYSNPLTDRVITSKEYQADISIIEAGAAAVKMRIDTVMGIPKGLSAIRAKRSDEALQFTITTYITLYDGIDRVDVVTEYHNICEDHRIRVVFPTGLEAETCTAAEKFEVTSRMVRNTQGFKAKEAAVSTYHQSDFMSINDGLHGFTLANKGLPEFEVVDKNGTVALTLLRAVGWLSRSDLLTRADNAGPDIEVPGAQCKRKQRAEYCFMLHWGNWEKAVSQVNAFSFVSGALAVPFLHNGNGCLQSEHSMIQTDNKYIEVSAFKKCEHNNNIIIRVYNISDLEQKVNFKISKDFIAWRYVNMAERPVSESTPVLSNEIAVTVNRNSAISIELLIKNHVMD